MKISKTWKVQEVAVMEMRILADLLEQAEEYGNTVDEVPAHEEDLEDPGDGGVEGDEEDNLPDPERLFNAEVVERRCIGRKKRVAFVGEGVLMRKSKRTKTVPRRLLD